MFNLFNKQQAFISHRFKNLAISLPANWEYELEEGDQEACFDSKSQSTLRINILKASPHEQKTAEENIKSLTANQPYVSTTKGYSLSGPTYRESTDGGENITLITWKLINLAVGEHLMAVLTYTVLSAEKDSAKEKGIVTQIENSLQNAELL